MAKMWMKLILSVLLFVTVYAAVPSYIHVCCRQDPKLSECIDKSVAMLDDKLRAGMPELDVPPTDPITLDEIEFANTESLKLYARNVKIYGFADYTLKSSYMDIEKFIYNVVVSFKSLKLYADYDVDSRLLVPIVGHGKVNITTNDIEANVTLQSKLVERNGTQYLYYTSVTTLLTIPDFNANFNINNNNQTALVTAANELLKNARQELIERFKPNVEKIVSKLIIETANKVSSRFSYDELLPNCT